MTIGKQSILKSSAKRIAGTDQAGYPLIFQEIL